MSFEKREVMREICKVSKVQECTYTCDRCGARDTSDMDSDRRLREPRGWYLCELMPTHLRPRHTNKHLCPSCAAAVFGKEATT